MNRMFTLEALSDMALEGYEPARAKVISDFLGPKGAWRGEPGDGQAADLCIDMHTTTANMGCTLIVDSWCALGLRAAAYVGSRWQEACGEAGVSAEAFPCRILVDEVTQAESTYVCTAARHGLMIEVGPTPQGLLRADVSAFQSIVRRRRRGCAVGGAAVESEQGCALLPCPRRSVSLPPSSRCR